MTASWVSGSVRARALGRRRLGRAGVRALAASPALPDALATLAATPYGHDVRVGMNLAQAQHAVADSALWNLRVLAGWLPSEGAEALRVLAGWFEIANVDELLRELTGSAAEPPYRLGTLAAAWPQLAGSTSATDLRERLGRSTWGDPGGDTRRDVQLALRLRWARRVAARVSVAQGAVVTATALLLAREGPAHGRRLAGADDASAVVGRAAAEAGSLPELTTALPSDARWVLQGVTGQSGLWEAETRWWRRLEERSFALARSARFDVRPVLGAVGLLAVDAWRVRAALALVGRDDAAEVLDAVA